jgi:3-phenylpropionate/cinnamic acid dioxygenase small subunit
MTGIDSALVLAEVSAFLHDEALALDERRWSDWLALFALDCEYWVPAWKNEDEQTSNPRRELSLIYYGARAGLEDRVWRVESRRSVASAVLPRTQHLISNVRVTGMRELPGVEGVGEIDVRCEWTVHQYLPKERTVELFFGRYEQRLIRGSEGLRIGRKKIVLLNDYLPARIDFYSL